ncbi:Six-hairpin glycosidase [Punctularia strigosozonata HHB-11173 SS5]|uniref:Six-hairpin glycosidase n=1 Tax=Punctularia strigosozonata (strain HHB-11173) TaxID=741275 RepID=UPI0004417CB4|nr:Six-hairpin glycosidase [Punctularia strigosozonata HHB-11173 SS5]EIN11862.1 Six-hairpin glycosidase [Punctularia strigosozonata HHB-11173 SS5]
MTFHLAMLLLSFLTLYTVGLGASHTSGSECKSTLSVAKRIVERLQSNYDQTPVFGYKGGQLWTDANALEDVHNYMLFANSKEFDNLAGTSELGVLAFLNLDWDIVLDGSYDDAQWLILAYWKVADYKNAHNEVSQDYLDAALAIYDLVASQWDTSNCGGGVWWSKDHTYKNAITNELFILTSAEGYKRYGNQTMLDNAIKAWSWLEGSGMRNAQGLYNDGIDFIFCHNNNETTWTYNQGVIASALGALFAATGNTTLLSEAEITLDAAISHLTIVSNATDATATNSTILKESCDDAVHSTCNLDQQIFKGIWTKHLMYYLDSANDTSRAQKYAPFIGSQAIAVADFAMNNDSDVGNVWRGSERLLEWGTRKAFADRPAVWPVSHIGFINISRREGKADESATLGDIRHCVDVTDRFLIICGTSGRATMHLVICPDDDDTIFFYNRTE